MTQTQPLEGKRDLPGFFGEELQMSMSKRILLSMGILLIDLTIFFLPLTALFLIYIILFNPSWFRKFLYNLNGTGRHEES